MSHGLLKQPNPESSYVMDGSFIEGLHQSCCQLIVLHKSAIETNPLLLQVTACPVLPLSPLTALLKMFYLVEGNGIRLSSSCGQTDPK